jgi:hypothetical protein
MCEKNVIEILESNKSLLCQLIGDLSENEINKRIKDYWSIYEHLEHLTLCQNIVVYRIKQFIEEEDPLIIPYIFENDENKGKEYSAKELLKRYCKLRDEQIYLIKKINKDIWIKNGRHEGYKKYTLEMLIKQTVLHDAFHIFHIEEIWSDEKKNKIDGYKDI